VNPPTTKLLKLAEWKNEPQKHRRRHQQAKYKNLKNI